MRSTRFWIGVGGRKYGITFMFYPFRWRWTMGDGPANLEEIYLGPLVISIWRPL